MYRKTALSALAAVALAGGTAWFSGTATAAGEMRPVVWKSIPCATVSISEAVVAEQNFRTAELRLSGVITPCVPAANGERFDVGIYNKARSLPSLFSSVTARYPTLYDAAPAGGPAAPTLFRIYPRVLLGSVHSAAGVCIATDFGVRVACWRVDDPSDKSATDMTLTAIPVDDPLVNRWLPEQVPVSKPGSDDGPDEICGTCWRPIGPSPDPSPAPTASASPVIPPGAVPDPPAQSPNGGKPGHGINPPPQD
jgi:hypothetical protein